MKYPALLLSILLCSSSFSPPVFPSFHAHPNEDSRSGKFRMDEQRELASFSSIEVHDAIAVIIERGEQSLRIEAPEKHLEKVLTSVHEGRLSIRLSEKVGRSRDIKIYISVKELKDLQGHKAATFNVLDYFKAQNFSVGLSGASSARLKVICNESLILDCSSASRLRVEGQAQEVIANLSGASELKAAEFEVDMMSVQASGASFAAVTVNGELKVEASGAARINYGGKAQLIKQTISGMASVKARS